VHHQANGCNHGHRGRFAQRNSPVRHKLETLRHHCARQDADLRLRHGH